MSALLTMAACEQEVVYPVDYNITLDRENTYRAGEPVKFNFTGDVDNVLFYSGEMGHQFQFKDRYEVPVEDVLQAELSMTALAEWGYVDGLKIYVTDRFPGLNGEDAEADAALIKSVFDNIPEGQDAPDGWERVPYQDEKDSGKKHDLSASISKYMSNFCIAFHFKPVMDGKSAQRTYYVDGSIDIQLKGAAPASMDFTDMGFKVFNFTEGTDPYAERDKTKSEKGLIDLDEGTWDLRFEGQKAEVLTQIDAWAISTPKPLNKVSNDKGTVIKDLQNYMDSFEYVWEEPGTYEVAFVGINSNFEGASKEIRKFTVTILDNTEL